MAGLEQVPKAKLLRNATDLHPGSVLGHLTFALKNRPHYGVYWRIKGNRDF